MGSTYICIYLEPLLTHSLEDSTLIEDQPTKKRGHLGSRYICDERSQSPKERNDTTKMTTFFVIFLWYPNLKN